MNYIDADRLRARIEKDLTYDNNIDTAFYIGRRDAERNILALIDSLQQEQTNAYDVAMLEVKKYVDNLYDNASIGLNEYESGFYNGIIETCMKLRGFIKARTSKEQPEGDLEAEIERYENEVHGFDSMSSSDCRNIARHFAEWGAIHLNARKK